MTNVWRIYLKKGTPKNNTPIHEYCFKNKIAAMGWRIESKDEEIKSGKIFINCYEEYEEYAKVEPNIGAFNNVKLLACEVKTGDYIWTRVDGEYYLSKVSPNSKYYYDCSDEAIENNACNQLTNINWKFVGNRDEINTDLINYLMGQTFCRLVDPKNKTKFEEVLKYTKEIYNKICGESNA